MPKAKNREAKTTRAISIAQYFAEGGHTVQDATEEFGIVKTTVERDMNYLRNCLISRAFSKEPQKERQILAWYNTARKNINSNNRSRARKSN